MTDLSEQSNYLGDLDPDDPRTESQQIASRLRAAILTRKVQPGDKLPSQPALASRYGVARETVKAAIRILERDRLTITRQGSGTFVRAQTERPVGLRPHIGAAFDQAHISIDFAGFSGETLGNALAEAFDKVKVGRLTPDSIDIRMMLSDMSVPMAIPSRADTGADDPAIRKRSDRIARRSAEGIVGAVAELVELGLIKSGNVAVRAYGISPLFKLYIVNKAEAFFGFYPVVEHSVQINGKSIAIYDAMGKDTVLFHHSLDAEDDSCLASQYVDQARTWFDSVWDTIARDVAL